MMSTLLSFFLFCDCHERHMNVVHLKCYRIISIQFCQVDFCNEPMQEWSNIKFCMKDENIAILLT